MSRLLLVILVWCIITWSDGFLTLEPEGPKDDLLQNAGYPKPGDIPVLNRKIFKGQRVTSREFPFVASIRRQCSHYLTGALITRTVVLTVAHPLVDVPIRELNVVVGENYSDRGTALLTVLLVLVHEEFQPYTLRNDIAMLRLYETVPYKSSVKRIALAPPVPKSTLVGKKAFVVGWGRCDNMGTELCLDRTSRYYPGEKMDPMLRAVSFDLRASNYYCTGYKRHEIRLRKGMLCAGVAREEDQVAPCLGVPGALLVVNDSLAGLLSWGFGCGYSYDLPLVYTDTRVFISWVGPNNKIMFDVKTSDLQPLFDATKASVLSHWLMETRNITPVLTVRTDKSLEPLPIDDKLFQLRGTVTDIRDEIADGRFKEEKALMYRNLRSEWEKTHLSAAKPKRPVKNPLNRPFLGQEAREYIPAEFRGQGEK